MFVSLGSIIGSGWLLGALTAAQSAGPASIISWLLAAAMLSLLALTYAELGATYPVAGGGGRFPYYSHGPIAGFTAGWAAWLQAVFVAPIEVLAAITYVNSVELVHDNFNMMHGKYLTFGFPPFDEVLKLADPDAGLLNGNGIIVAIVLMLVFTAINLAGAKFLSESNIFVVVWKTIVPFLAVGVVAGIQFDTDNFSAGGGFMPHGFHGVFAALTGGVVFALQGFEQAVHLAGEARNPKRDLSRAILTAMAIGAVLYSLLQIVLIGGLDPKYIVDNWDMPLGGDPSVYGAWYSLALALGAGWLAQVLLVDAVISPAGTGVVYVGTSARLSYALGEEREMPAALSKTTKKGVPLVSICVSAVVGCIAFGPFKSWKSLVEVITSATAIMYAFAPVSLAALHRLDPQRPRTYRMPLPDVLLPIAFVSANLIIYWGGFETTWKLAAAMGFGWMIFAIGAVIGKTKAFDTLANSIWMLPWLLGHVVFGYLGGYGGGADLMLPWVDILLVAGFAIGIFYAALAMTVSRGQAAAAIAKDARQIDYDK
jgi:amino acid transporter